MTDSTNIDWSQIGIITGFVVTVGTVFLGVASKIFKFGRVSQRLDHIEKDLDETIKPELKSLRDTIASETKALQTRFDARFDDVLQSLALKQVSKSRSPRALNDFGQKVLSDSNIHAIIQPELTAITDKVKAHHPENAYQVQELLIDIMQDLKQDQELKNDIETAAFQSGVDVDTVLLVAAIDIRDMVLEELGMKPDEIDLHKPAK